MPEVASLTAETGLAELTNCSQATAHQKLAVPVQAYSWPLFHPPLDEVSENPSMKCPKMGLGSSENGFDS
jgi:hypothetical protein